MKQTFVVLALVLSGLVPHAQFSKASLQASGLTCSMCNNAIYKALKALPFVSSVDSDIKHASFGIVFKENANMDIDAIKNAVEEAGFSVASFTITGNFDHVSIGNDKHVVIDGRHFHFIKVTGQVLNGLQTLTVVDKNFLTAKNFKKFSAATRMTCIQTGKAGPCCEKEDGVTASTRIYHVTI